MPAKIGQIPHMNARYLTTEEAGLNHMYRHKITLKVELVMDDMSADDPAGSALIAEEIVSDLIATHWDANAQVSILNAEDAK